MQTLGSRLLYGLATRALSSLARLPLGLAYWLGACLGDLLYLVLAERRRITFANRALAFDTDKTAGERHRLARTTFRHPGQHLVGFSHVCQLISATFATSCELGVLE